MKYLLDQEEFDALDKRAKAGDKAPNKKKLQEFCTMVANSLPVKGGWMDGKIWGCILTSDDEWYCDDCPAQEICPNSYKEWSK